MADDIKYLGPEGLDTLIDSIVDAYAKKVDVVNPTTSGAMLHKGTSEFKKHMTGYTAEFEAIASGELGTDMLNANNALAIIVGAKLLLNHDASLNYTDESGVTHKISSLGSNLGGKVDKTNPASQVIESTAHSTPIFLKSNLEQESWLGFKNVNGANIGYYGVVDNKPIYYYGENKEIALVDDVNTTIAGVNDRVDGLEQLINSLDILDEEEF